MKIVVTGSAGFIGHATCERLLTQGHTVLGIDNLNSYYDVKLKERRLERLTPHKNFKFIKFNLADKSALQGAIETFRPEKIVHLAAQAGVRYSIEHPELYLESNINAFLNILEVCRHSKINHLIYASTSSVYGLNSKQPFSTSDPTHHPVSLYSATKISNELMAHTYSHLFSIPTTGLRFFTVYGPWGRPDMALFKFVKNILNDEPIDVYNNGHHARDFTYIDDIVTGVVSVTTAPPPQENPKWDPATHDPSSSISPYRVYNIGRGKPENLMKFISVIESHLGKKAKLNMLPMQAGDVESTMADIEDMKKDFDYQPKFTIEDGVKKFVDWYLEYENPRLS